MTADELLALPENGGCEIVTDPQTGHTERVRRPVQFLVNDSDVFVYWVGRDAWVVGRGIDGKRYRERRHF